MKFVLKPSLERMALIKIVISLWNQNDVWALISKLNYIYRYSSEEWKTIEERVRENVQQLALPEFLKENVLCLVKPIGLEILMWMDYNWGYLYVNLPTELFWTPQGTVNRKKTAEVLVRDENLDMFTRLKLACVFCLEDDILELWNCSTENLKKSLLDSGIYLIHYWSHNMMYRGFDNARISCKYEFEECAIRNNKVAAEYFLQKLTPWEREECLVRNSKHVTDDDILYFLISEMNQEQQMTAFKNNPHKVLMCFLQWPFQSFFTAVANCMWNFLPKDDFYFLLKEIINKVRDGYKDCNYQKLFREFWQKSPNFLKSFITNEIHTSCLLPFLFDLKDKENIRLILKDTSRTAKDELIYSDDMNSFCQYSICDNEWDFLEFFIQECLPSKDEMLKFKEEMEKRLMHSYFKEHFETKKQEWDQLFHMSYISICKYNKRSVEEDESSSSKRFQNRQ